MSIGIETATGPGSTSGTSFTIQKPGEPCNSTKHFGRLLKHCWHDPRPRGREPYHADPYDQPRDEKGRFLPFTDNRGNRDSYGHLRLHHRESFYYSNCLVFDCDVDLRDGLTRAGNGYTIGEGDKVYLPDCCGIGYTVVRVEIERHGDKCWKKAYLLRDSPSWCWMFWNGLPIPLHGTVHGGSINTPQSFIFNFDRHAGIFTSDDIEVECALDIENIRFRAGCNKVASLGADPNANLPLDLEASFDGGSNWTPGVLPATATFNCDPFLIDYFNFDALLIHACSQFRVTITQ